MLEVNNQIANKFALYVLGAGFSHAAGLPLAAELWPEVCRRALRLKGRASRFRRDLDYFIGYKKNCDGVSLNYTSVDFEEFLAFLDIEHHLGLRGSDTWSDDGNESQIVVKTLIGQILTERTPRESDIPDIYVRFAKSLRPHDIVLTFNYDILLEGALEIAGIPYRLVADRYTSVDKFGGLIDLACEEVIVLKVHGSLDWFDRRPYSEIQKDHRKIVGSDPHYPIFNDSPPFEITPIVQGPCFPEDPLGQIHRVRDIERLYADPPWFVAAPCIVNPSTAKVVYAERIPLWRGLGEGGIANFRLVIIGYSLPSHDYYARQILYRLIRNYQSVPANRVSSEIVEKDPLIIIDYQPHQAALEEFKKRYRFVDWSSSLLLVDGFGEQSSSHLQLA